MSTGQPLRVDVFHTALNRGVITGSRRWGIPGADDLDLIMRKQDWDGMLALYPDMAGMISPPAHYAGMGLFTAYRVNAVMDLNVIVVDETEYWVWVGATEAMDKVDSISIWDKHTRVLLFEKYKKAERSRIAARQED